MRRTAGGFPDPEAGESSQHQTALDDPSLARYAAEAGVDGEVVLVDLQESRYREQICESFIGGARRARPALIS